MSDTFHLEIVTPRRVLFRDEVSEVVLPAYDGEAGVMAQHEDFIGLLGTGVLKIVKDGDDYWFVVSSGVYEVRNGTLKVIAEMGQEAGEVDVAAAQSELKALEPKLDQINLFEPESQRLKVEYDRAKARIQVHRRTELLN